MKAGQWCAKAYVVFVVLTLVQTVLAFDPSSPFGVVAFVPSPNRWQAIQDARIGWARCDFSWRSVENPQGTFNWGNQDSMVSEANARGINIYAGLGYTPSWASSGGQSYSPPTNTANWTNYVTTAVNRYKASIHYWEIWNEPNLSQFWGGTQQQYISNILIPAADAIHAADPTAKVVAPEVSSCCSTSNWLSTVLSQAGSRIDVICYHQYDGGDTPSGRLSAIDTNHTTIVNAGYGSKDLWITECGWRSDSGGLNETIQGQYLAAMLAGMETRPWFKKFFWYQIWEGNPGEKWGLLHPDESRKPAWYNYQAYAYASAWGPQTPFATVNIPGTIQAENYDNGGEGVGYHDLTGGNTGGAYRGDNVDIENTGDVGGGYNVGWIDTGEWLKYTVNVTATGTYAFNVRVATPNSGGKFHIEVQGKNVSGTKTVPVTGGWQTYTTVSVPGIAVSAGSQVVRVIVEVGSWNLNYIDVGQSQTPFGGTNRTIPGTIQAEDFDDGGEGVAYHDTDAGNNGGAYRSTDVDIEGCADTGGGYNVGWINPGEWLEYTVNVTNTGDHTFKMRIADCCATGSLHLEMNGSAITGTKYFDATGGWQNWTTITIPAVFLSAGNNQVLRVAMDGNMNLNKVDVTYGGNDAVSEDLGTTNSDDGMSHPICCDGNTTPASIGGHQCRQNVTPSVDTYMYFAVADIYSFQGSRPDLWITIEYYDTGTGSLTLQYDATSSPYKTGPSVTLTNTNTWKTGSAHVTDAYFGNRQNGGADFRIARGASTTWYLDTVQVSPAQP